MRTTTYEYNGSNDRVRETAADGAVTEYSYDSARKLVQIAQLGSSDPDLLGAHRRLRAARADVQPTTTPAGCSTFINADGTVETYAYDSANNKTLETVQNPASLPSTGTPEPDARHALRVRRRQPPGHADLRSRWR